MRLHIDVVDTRRYMLRWEPDNLPPRDPRTLHLLQEEIALWGQHSCFELSIDQG